MKTYPIYQVDAFTSTLFAGNPAAVVPLENFLPSEQLQSLAAENNLSETAFVVPRPDGENDGEKGGQYDLRWFTPTAEVDFCGHATIASAHVILTELKKPSPVIFHTKIGRLQVSLGGEGYEMCAPIFPMVETELTDKLKATFKDLPVAAWQSRKNIFLMFPSADAVADFKPDFSAIKALSAQKGVDDGIVIMAAGNGSFANYDFVSRYFVPAFGIDEDPVTGSNHASLAPFWAKRLEKKEMLAYQASARGGALKLRLAMDKVYITGQAITYMRGNFYLPE